MINKKKELKIGALLSYAASGLGIIISLLFNPVIIKNLGQNEYGLYETIGSFVNYLSILDFGFSSVVVRYVAKYEAENNYVKRDEFLYTARRIYQVLCLGIVAIGAVMFCFIKTVFGSTFSAEELSKAHLMFVIVLATTCVSIYTQVYGGAIAGVERFIVPRIIRICKVLLSKSVAILVVLLGADSVGYTFVLFAFELMSFIVFRMYAAGLVKFQKCKIVFSEVKELLVFTSFLLLQAIAAQLYWQIDKVVLGAMIGTSIVAVYSISLTLQSLVQNIAGSIKDMLLPRATKLSIDQKNQHEVMPFMIKGGRIVLMSYALFYIGLMGFGREFLVLWLGETYEPAYSIYLILGAFAILPTVLGIGETVCRAYNKHQFLSRVSLIAAVINFGLTIIGIKLFGYIGAAYATAIGLLLGSTIIPLLYYKKIFPFSVFGFLKELFSRCVVSFVVSIAFAFGCNYVMPSYSWLTLILKALLVTGVYFISLILFGFTPYEKKLFFSYFKVFKKLKKRHSS